MNSKREFESLYFVATIACSWFTCFYMTSKYELESLYFVANIASVYTLL